MISAYEVSSISVIVSRITYIYKTIAITIIIAADSIFRSFRNVTSRERRHISSYFHNFLPNIQLVYV